MYPTQLHVMTALRAAQMLVRSPLWHGLLALVAALPLPVQAQGATPSGVQRKPPVDCWKILGTQGWGSPPVEKCFENADEAANAMLPAFDQTWQVGCYMYNYSPGGYTFPDGVNPGFTSIWVNGLEHWSYPAPGCFWSESYYGVNASRRVGFIFRESVSERCPDNSVSDPSSTGQPCRCEAGFAANAARTACYPTIIRDNTSDPPSCGSGDQPSNPGFGNPIIPLTGTKSVSEPIGSWLGLAFAAEYSTQDKVPSTAPGDFGMGAPASFGPMWRSTVHKSLALQRSRGTAASVSGVLAYRGGWKVVSFQRNPAGEFVAPPGSQDRLSRRATDGRWIYFDASAGTFELYSGQGHLMELVRQDGRRWTYFYESFGAPQTSRLTRIEDSDGRAVSLAYEASPVAGQKARVSSLVAPDGSVVTFSYNSGGYLRSITFPDGAARTLLYESGQQPWAVTGRVDENGTRSAAYTYDTSGRAVATERAGGLDRYSVSYGSPPFRDVRYTVDEIAKVVFVDINWLAPAGTLVTAPNGSLIPMVSQAIHGKPRLSSQGQPAGSGCGPAVSTAVYDAAGNLSQRDDFNGTRTCYRRDAQGRAEETIEGLSGGTPGTACSSVLAIGNVATLPSGARRTLTQWHAQRPLRLRVAQPGQIVTLVYNGQPDPFNGGAIASCAPASATMPDGTATTVLCKQVQQATTDDSGAYGFAASPAAGVPQRVSQWTYDGRGRRLSSTDPVGNVSTFSYYSSGSADYREGDLAASTNALGHSTQYTKYNGSGQLLQSTDANGVVSSYTYDGRGRQTSATVAGATTAYEYWPTGLLKKVTLPDGSSVAYEYDAAQRMVAMQDGLGNRLEYTLDASGNRVAEKAKDPSGVLRTQVSRVFDALNRVQQVTGRE